MMAQQVINDNAADVELLRRAIERLCRSTELFGLFTVAKSRKELTDEEKRARKVWKLQRENFLKTHMNSWLNLNYARSRNALLNSSILPMVLDPTKASLRSGYQETRHKRLYPDTLSEWVEFGNEATQDFEEFMLKFPMRCSLDQSINWRNEGVPEQNEEEFIKRVLFDRLNECNLMGAEINSMDKVVHGLPDMAVRYIAREENEDVTIVIEFKSTQNLLVPDEFVSIKQFYEEALKNQTEEQSSSRSRHWSQIGHPFAQLFGYMIDNKTRFGALCSGYKTYFVFFDSSGVIRVTRAWGTYEYDFVKAWANFIRLAEEHEYDRNRITIPQAWLTETPIAKKRQRKEDESVEHILGGNSDEEGGGDEGGNASEEEDSNDDGGAKRSGCLSAITSAMHIGRNVSRPSQGEKSRPNAKSASVSSNWTGDAGSNCQLPPLTRTLTPNPFSSFYEKFDAEEDFVGFIDFSLLKSVMVLGSGRNGTVFQCKIGEENYAVKQFDITKNVKSYMREIEAYKKLKSAWGDLVPKPEFVSASPSGNVRYLGMTLGELPPEKEFDEEFYRKIETLEERFNFRHLDYDLWEGGPNYVLSKDSRNVLVIDLEQWEEVKKAQA